MSPVAPRASMSLARPGSPIPAAWKHSRAKKNSQPSGVELISLVAQPHSPLGFQRIGSVLLIERLAANAIGKAQKCDGTTSRMREQPFRCPTPVKQDRIGEAEAFKSIT